jgi:hypothetical protein
MKILRLIFTTGLVLFCFVAWLKSGKRVPEGEWSNAGKTAAVGNVEIEIETATIGKPLLIVEGETTAELDIKCVMISLIIRNNSPDQTVKCTFRLRSDTTSPRLYDESGNYYSILLNSGKPEFVGQLPDGSLIDPMTSAKDSLVFAPLEDGDDAKELRLQLPGGSVGATSDFLLRVPAPGRS